jgi:hypothetical protein
LASAVKARSGVSASSFFGIRPCRQAATGEGFAKVLDVRSVS